jgi:hypothetical protein
MIIILMEILDDELIYKITWSPDCQATFKKYKKKILRKILLKSLLAFFLISFLIFLFYSGYDFFFRAFCVPMVSVSMLLMALSYPLFCDYLSKKLKINRDTFKK